MLHLESLQKRLRVSCIMLPILSRRQETSVVIHIIIVRVVKSFHGFFDVLRRLLIVSGKPFNIMLLVAYLCIKIERCSKGSHTVCSPSKSFETLSEQEEDIGFLWC